MQMKNRSLLQRRVLVSMIFIGLSLLGYISLQKLPLELLPNIEPPVLFVQIGSAQEMDPKYLEQKALIPVEGAIGTLESIDKITSSANRRNGSIIISYHAGTDMKYAFLKLQEKIEAVKAQLGTEFFVTALKVDTQDISNQVMTLQIQGSGGVDRIRKIVEEQIKTRLEAIDGLANVEVFGGQIPSVTIRVNNSQAEAYGLTVNSIRQALARNRQSIEFVGQVRQNQLNTSVNIVADFTEIAQIKNVVLDRVRKIRLSDVATVDFDIQEETSISRINGKESVTIQLNSDTQSNKIELANSIKQKVEELNQKLSSLDIKIVIQHDNTETLVKNVDLIINLAVSGSILAILVLWYFIRRIRLVLIIALIIPISVLIAFNLFYALGITLNNLTLVGMALAVGMLIDNSVVVLENIYRLAALKKDMLQAAKEGTLQMVRSVSAATFTTIAIFLPFIFADNFAVKVIGYQVGISIVSTLIISLLSALLLIPMATYYFLTNKEIAGATEGQITMSASPIIPFYNLFLKSFLRFPVRTISMAVLIFILSLGWAFFYGMTQDSEVELTSFNLYVTMAPGATLEKTDMAVAELEEKLKEVKEVENVVSQIYEDQAILTLELYENYADLDNRSIDAIKDDVDEIKDNYDAAEVSFDQPENSERFRGGGGGDGFSSEMMSMFGIGGGRSEIIITGNDIAAMHNYSEDIVRELEDLSSVSTVATSAARKRPELHLLFDKFNLSQRNITLTEIGSELSNFRNEVNTGLTYKTDESEYDIIIENDDLEEKNRDDLRTLVIPNSENQNMQLADLATDILAEGDVEIRRENQERRIMVRFRFEDEIGADATLLDAAKLELENTIASLPLPTGTAVQVKFDTFDFSDFTFLFGIGFLLVFFILSAVFESLLKPFIIMFTIPLAATGSLWAVVLAGKSVMDVYVFMGLLILLGIVVNNGIILIDFAQQLRRKNMRITRAIMATGHARLRPILITTLTTIMAMVPLAMGDEEYVSVIAAPFAITVIGGLSLSTLFTLVFIPTVYSGMESMVKWFKELHIFIRIAQILLFVAGYSATYLWVESWLNQIILYFAILAAVPGGTYFLMHSLRSAKSDFIAPSDSLRIEINNVYKIYGQAGRFISEWRRKRARGTSQNEESGFERILNTILRVTLLIFSAYFIYWYMEDGFLIFLLMPLFFIAAMHFVKATLQQFTGSKKLARWGCSLLYWAFPLINMAFYYIKAESITASITVALFWFPVMLISTTSKKIERENIDIVKIKGKLARLKKLYYNAVMAIPIIGKKVKPFKALDGVSLTIENGMFGLLGPNGAGKTTLMRIICGILDQSYGTLKINGYDVNQNREELQGMIGYLPQDFGMYENLTARTFLEYQAMQKGITDKKERTERIEKVLKAVDLQDKGDEEIGSFSGGMKQRVGIAKTLLHLPRILVVDEPTAGLDPRERIRFRNLLVELARERIVIFSTHVIEDIASSCDRVAVLSQGNVRYLGQPKMLAHEAEGKVWQLSIKEEELDAIQQKFTVTHHARIEDHIRVRLLSKQKPFEQAQQVKPTLEDAYLWLLKNQA